MYKVICIFVYRQHFSFITKPQGPLAFLLFCKAWTEHTLAEEHSFFPEFGCPTTNHARWASSSAASQHARFLIGGYWRDPCFHLLAHCREQSLRWPLPPTCPLLGRSEATDTKHRDTAGFIRLPSSDFHRIISFELWREAKYNELWYQLLLGALKTDLEELKQW